jgi:hypothetical protein
VPFGVVPGESDGDACGGVCASMVPLSLCVRWCACRGDVNVCAADVGVLTALPAAVRVAVVLLLVVAVVDAVAIDVIELAEPDRSPAARGVTLGDVNVDAGRGDTALLAALRGMSVSQAHRCTYTTPARRSVWLVLLFRSPRTTRTNSVS